MNNAGLDYVLIRNIDNELPGALEVGKDIDLLIKKKDEPRFHSFFRSGGYETINHPFKDDVFLYGVDRFEFKYNNSNNILFDLNFQLAVRSLDAGQWIPLDQFIQDSAWKNKRFEEKDESFSYWSLGYEDELVCLVSRSIFDKKKFHSGYARRISELMLLVNSDEVEKRFNLVFFKFTRHLLDLLVVGDFDSIISKYLRFDGY